MSPRLSITSYVVKRVCGVAEGEATGSAYGLMYDGTLLVVGFSLHKEPHQHSRLLLHLPTEVDLCGVVRFGEGAHADRNVKEILQDVDMTDNPLVLAVGVGGAIKAHFLVHDRLEETSYEVLPAEELWRKFVHVRIHAALPIVCEATAPALKNVLQAQRKKIAAGQVSFHMEGSSVYVLSEAGAVGVEDEGADLEPTLAQLVESISPEQKVKKKKFTLNNVDIVPVNILMKVTKDIVGENFVKSVVKMLTMQGRLLWLRVQLSVCGLALVSRDVRVPELYSVLVETACRAMRLLEDALPTLDQEGVGDGAGLRVPETYHFLPPELGHFVTIVRPRGEPDECAENDRRLLHGQFALPTDRPVFRRGNAYLSSTCSLLVNPHEAIPPAPPRRDVITAVVRGRYTYHHYMQDQFNDDGWGCAYRSLQTLCSWFRLQGYTNEPIPTHREIQQCLVDIGDKPATFVGSKQWIGSTEVSFCLETLLKVQSRIIFASSGAELREYSTDLVHHFQKHGSPIMIGGGVLAHTIIGVEYNTESHDTRYLILDPHYTGQDDLASVVGKGWCAWKASDFWNKTAHYNLCLPQTRPCI